MRLALLPSRPTRRLPAILAALLCSLLLTGPIAAPALAQDQLIAPAQTKDEAAKARDEAAKAEDTSTGISTEWWLVIGSVVLIGGATVYMLRDSRAAVGDDRRAAPAKAFTPSTERGAPKNMFEGEARPGGQVGKNKKRVKSKRQKQARRANRPK